MLQFGMPTLIEINHLEDTMKLCRELGLSFIELNMNLPQYQTEHMNNIPYLQSLKEKYQIGYTIHLDENLDICNFNKAVSAAYTNTVIKTINFSRALDVPVINMHMNHGVHFTLPERKVFLYEQYFADYMESWKNFCAICEKSIGDSDIKICIENTDGYRDYEKSAIAYLLQNEVFGLTWDIGHSNAVANIDERFILSNSNKLYHFHVHDSLGKNDHMALGTGKIDLAQRFRIAEDCQCRCVVETKTVEALRMSVFWLRKNNYLPKFHISE